MVHREARDASMRTLDEKILKTIATARFANQIRHAESVPAAPVEQESRAASNSKPGALPPLGKTLKVPSSPRLPAASPRSPQSSRALSPADRNALPRSTDTVQADEVQEQARKSAQKYLDQRKSRIRQLRNEGRARITGTSPAARRASQDPRTSRNSRSSVRSYAKGVSMMLSVLRKMPSNTSSPHQSVEPRKRASTLPSSAARQSTVNVESTGDGVVQASESAGKRGASKLLAPEVKVSLH